MTGVSWESDFARPNTEISHLLHIVVDIWAVLLQIHDRMELDLTWLVNVF